MNQIPTDSSSVIATHNTKEAALMYALAECSPLFVDGKMSARWQQEEDKQPQCWFFFNANEMGSRIHSAFTDPSYEARHSSEQIPDKHLPAVIALIKSMWHNWERLREVTKIGATNEMPLHFIVHKNGKIYCSTKPGDSK